MNVSDLFSNPATIAAFAALVAYLAGAWLRQWVGIDPRIVAVVVAVLVYAGGRFLGQAEQQTIIEVIELLLAVLAAMGVSVIVRRPEADDEVRTMGRRDWRRPW